MFAAAMITSIAMMMEVITAIGSLGLSVEILPVSYEPAHFHAQLSASSKLTPSCTANW